MSGRALTPEAFAEILGVSRETLRRLESYVDLVGSWNRRINLVSAGPYRSIAAKSISRRSLESECIESGAGF